jgi:hypothetical protein
MDLKPASERPQESPPAPENRSTKSLGCEVVFSFGFLPGRSMIQNSMASFPFLGNHEALMPEFLIIVTTFLGRIHGCRSD